MTQGIKDRLSEEQLREVLMCVTQALCNVDSIRVTKECEVCYETMQRSGFKRKTGWRRKYSLRDARSDAESAAIHLRAAWELLDPMIG